MERRIVTRMEWDFDGDIKYDGMTDLPLPKKGGPRPRLISMTASSSVIHLDHGYLCAHLDRLFGDLAASSPMTRRLMRMQDSWGKDARGRSVLWVEQMDKKICAEFRVAGTRKPFCDVAIERTLQLFRLLGVKVERLPHPLVVQETYVRAARQPGGLKDWIPYGEWLWRKRIPLVREPWADEGSGREMP